MLGKAEALHHRLNQPICHAVVDHIFYQCCTGVGSSPDSGIDVARCSGSIRFVGHLASAITDGGAGILALTMVYFMVKYRSFRGQRPVPS
jgi:hypothetical protein